MTLAQHAHHAGVTLDSTLLVAVVLLGMFHGVNPGMGWLFAVSFGMQERRRAALLRSLLPIAVGHELSVVPIAVAIAVFASTVSRAVAVTVLAIGLVVVGIVLLLRKRHFRWVGIRLSAWQLGWWSFLMSTATGAGLMLAPLLLGEPQAAGTATAEAALSGPVMVAVVAAAVHGAAMLLTMGAVALVVYEIVGLRILRTAWVNLDKVWAGTFIAAGALVWLQ